jgi:hypothetical protein
MRVQRVNNEKNDASDDVVTPNPQRKKQWTTTNHERHCGTQETHNDMLITALEQEQHADDLGVSVESLAGSNEGGELFWTVPRRCQSLIATTTVTIRIVMGVLSSYLA